MDLSILKKKVKDTLKSINKQNTKKMLKSPIFWARFLGYAIPLIFLLYVLYINYIPFGYNKTFIIDVGSDNDTTVSEFYLEPSQDLSEHKTNPDGTTYRELAGMTTAVFKPNVVLEDAEITVEVEGEGVSLISPYLDFDPNSIEWDKSWDFNKGIPIDLINNSDKAFLFDGATYFDGTARLELASSSDMFENEAFTVYAEWMPTDDSGDGQQIIGHYNWRIIQNKETVDFRIGKMNDKEGGTYSIKYPITKDFFNKKHTAIVIYSPSEINGYIELFIDNKFIKLVCIGPDKIWSDYGNKNITFGKSYHGSSQYFKGSLYKINIIKNNILLSKQKINLETKYNGPLNVILLSTTTTALNKIKLNVFQK